MALGRCEECDTLQQIVTTGVALQYRDGIPVGSACYWSVCMHVDLRVERDADGRRPICLGSGRRV